MPDKYYIKNSENGDIIRTRCRTLISANKRVDYLDSKYGSKVHTVVTDLS